jgi:hypothetical protein
MYMYAYISLYPGHRFLCIDLISSCDADLHVVDATIRFSVLLVGLLV